MNLCRLQILAEWLEADAPRAKGAKGFNMSVWRRSNWHMPTFCGTTCCIAGAASMFWKEEQLEGVHPRRHAQHVLDLTDEQALNLFYAYNCALPLAAITAAHAARVVRRLVTTGQVDWR